MPDPLVDIARWRARYPLRAHRQALDARVREFHEKDPASYPTLAAAQQQLAFWYCAPNDIFSPRDLAVTEQMRDEIGGPAAMGPPVPVDLLLPAFGEPPRRDISKIGGLPYRPPGPWPRDRSGQPLSFIAQLCLTDSRDILPKFTGRDLPGDVLLIFQDYDDILDRAGRGPQLTFEWQPHGLKALVEPADIPDYAVKWSPTYFERYRSTEHPEIPASVQSRIDQSQTGLSGLYWASKIGGLPAWQQGDEGDKLGRYFASIHSINPSEDEFPFPNLEKAPWGRHPYGQGFFMLGDVGTLYLFAQGDGKIGWLMQCG